MVEEKTGGGRDDGTPLIPSIPQDEREEASAGRRKSRKGVGGPSFDSPPVAEAQDDRPPRKRGGGPKTPEGRAAVRLNAVKHGVLAETPVLPLVESEERWEELRRDVLDWFGLEGPFMESLGTRAATLVWRLERAARLETEAARHYQRDVPEDWKSSMQMQGIPIPDRKTKERVEEEYRMLMARLLPGDEILDKVLRYETRLHRYLLQTIYLIMVMKGSKKTRVSRFWGLPELNSPEISGQMGMPPSPGS